MNTNFTPIFKFFPCKILSKNADFYPFLTQKRRFLSQNADFYFLSFLIGRTYIEKSRRVHLSHISVVPSTHITITCYSKTPIFAEIPCKIFPFYADFYTILRKKADFCKNTPIFVFPKIWCFCGKILQGLPKISSKNRRDFFKNRRIIYFCCEKIYKFFLLYSTHIADHFTSFLKKFVKRALLLKVMEL